MKMKKAVSWILSLMLVFTMIPALGAAAYAEDGGAPAIALGAGNIEKGNKVYMGIRYVDSNAAPISWLVLGNANSSNLKDNNYAAVSPDNARLLITEKTHGDVHFDYNGQSNTWQGSDIQNWCTDTFLNDSDWNGSRYQDHFTESEKSTMLSTSKTDDEYTDDQENEWGTSELKNEKLFVLSAEEVSDEYGYFKGNESRIAYRYNIDETKDWWLRSPYSDHSDYVARVSPDGNVRYYHVYNGFGARPAFNFDLTSVLFTSAAVGGKSSGACGADALSAISTNSTNEWELTLKDTSRSGFNAKAATGATLQVDEGYSGWSIPIVYSGANTGDNEYVSVILCDSEETVMYYGSVAQNSAASSDAGQTVNIPDGLTAGSYTMYVFNEQINGDKLTDYSSEFSRIELTVTKPPVETFTVTFKAEGGTWQDGTTSDKEVTVEKGQAATAPDVPAREGYTFNGWDPEDFSNITSNLTVTAQWKKNDEPAPTPSTEPSAAAPAVTEVTINKATVSAAVIRQAIQAAGGSADTVIIGKKVKRITAKAFAGTDVKTLIVKSKKLKKKAVKGSLKGSSVTTVRVKVGKAKLNKKYVKKYKKIFTKKNAGKKVKVR